MELLALLFIRIFIAIIELAVYLIKLPFMLIGSILRSSSPKKTVRRKTASRKTYRYSDPIEKMERDFDNGELDMEDCFWMDELMG